jgi:hypothetical protein
MNKCKISLFEAAADKPDIKKPARKKRVFKTAETKTKKEKSKKAVKPKKVKAKLKKEKTPLPKEDKPKRQRKKKAETPSVPVPIEYPTGTMVDIKNWIRELRNSYSITKHDILYIYRNVIFGKSFGELKQIMTTPELHDSLPSIVCAIIAGVLGDIGRGNILNITRMLNLVFPSGDFERLEDTISTDKMSDSSGYLSLKQMENTLRKLEGDDSIEIVDKLMLEGEAVYERSVID